MAPVIVNFNVTVDASGSVEVFGQAPVTISNKIVASVPIPTSVTEGIIEFWEPSSAIGSRAATFRAEERYIRSDIAHALNSCLGSPIDCSAAAPFNNLTYSGQSSYTTQSDFGRLALSAYAHYLFGHMAATAAISNDQDVMNSMLASPLYTQSGGEYDVGGNVNPEWTASSNVNSNLACRLVHALIASGDVNALAITEQVLGQDASRAMDQDNNALAPDNRQLLRFLDGDKIYINIKVLGPTVNVSASGNNAVPLSTDYPSNESGDINYALEITLRDFVTITPKVDPISNKYWNRYDISGIPGGFLDNGSMPWSIKFDVNISSAYPLNNLYSPNRFFITNSDISVPISVRNPTDYTQVVPCIPGTSQESFVVKNYNVNGVVIDFGDINNPPPIVHTRILSFYKGYQSIYNVGKTFTFPAFDGQ